MDTAEGFHLKELARLITDRGAVRIALVRNPIHLVTARDCLKLRPLVPLVQVPPRGIRRKSEPAAHTTAEAWLGRPSIPTLR